MTAPVPADGRGLRMVPGHVAPATLDRAEAVTEDAARFPDRVVVDFDRIGRHGTTSLRIDSTDPDEIARQIRAHIRTNRLIASREYDVHVDVEAGVVLLEGGRFGRGAISRPGRPADGRAQQAAWRERILRAVEGPDSAQARRYAKRRLLDELHAEALAEDLDRVLPLRPSVSEIRAAAAELPECDCPGEDAHTVACRRGERPS